MCMFHTNLDGEDVYIGNAVPPVPDLTGVEMNQAKDGGRPMTAPIGDDKTGEIDASDSGLLIRSAKGKAQNKKTAKPRGKAGRKPTKRAAEIAEIAAILPTKPNEMAWDYIHSDDCIEDLGANFLIWERVPLVRETVPLKKTMTPKDWDRYERGKKPYWGVECKCTFCGWSCEGRWERKGKGKNRETRIVLSEVDFGYIGFLADCTEGWEAENRDGVTAVYVTSGEWATCPTCGRWLRVRPKSFLRDRAHVWRHRLTTIETNGTWGGVFYWMAELPLDKEGDGWLDVLPEHALIVSKGGELLHFVFDGMAWSYKQTRNQRKAPVPIEQIGRDRRGAEIQARMAPTSAEKFWSDTYDKRMKSDWIMMCGIDQLDQIRISDFTGTLEKTGIEDAFDYDILHEEPWNAEAYLRFWAKQPRIEVLARDGWQDLVREILRGEYPALLLDWSQTKPHQILGLSKEDYRATKDGGSRWTAKELKAFRFYNRGRKAPISAAEYNDFMDQYERQLFRWFRAAEKGGAGYLRFEADAWDLRKMDRYLAARQEDNVKGLETLTDYRIGAAALNALHTSRDYWPKDLQAAHDKTTAALAATGSDIETHLEFQRIAEELAPLTWTDGVYMIRVAASPTELQAEGAMLNHCVGTYAAAMAEGTDTIFFVRRRKRPERSWLTLDMNLQGNKPVEQALHGWYNEGTPEQPGMPNIKTKRQIPKRGRDFVERWKREVLEPWWKERHNKNADRRRRSA